jgi:hypothetical protein
MELKLKINKDIQLIQQKNKIVWRSSAKSRYLLVLYFLLLGAFFISIGAMSNFTFKVMAGEGGTKIYSLHIAVTLGVAFWMFAVFNLIVIQSARKKFFNKIDRYIQSVYKKEVFLYINDISITYEDFEIKEELKWGKFTSYKYQNGILFLLLDEDLFTLFIISEKETDDFPQLLSFIKKKIPGKNK